MKNRSKKMGNEAWKGLAMGFGLGLLLGTDVGHQLLNAAFSRNSHIAITMVKPRKCPHGVLAVHKKVITCLGCGTVIPILPKGKVIKI
jgi:hypothetical protein